MRILIIDDDPVVRHILSAMLTGYAPQFLPSEGATVTLSSATSGKEGIAAVSTAAAAGALPDLIFLDLQLLDMTGFEVRASLRAEHGDRVPPLVLMSAQPRLELEKQHEDCDWSLFLQKPFLPEQVVAAAQHAASRRNNSDSLAT